MALLFLVEPLVHTWSFVAVGIDSPRRVVEVPHPEIHPLAAEAVAISAWAVHGCVPMLFLIVGICVVYLLIQRRRLLTVLHTYVV